MVLHGLEQSISSAGLNAKATDKMHAKQRHTISYGSCNLAEGSIPENLSPHLPLLNHTTSSSGSEEDSWSFHQEDDDEYDINAFLTRDSDDEEAPPPPSRRRLESRSSSNSPSPPNSLMDNNSSRRRVSFHESATRRQSRSPDFRASWRRKSVRRISLLAQQQQPRKTAKERWALLRDYVKSGAFFLNRDSYHSHATYRNSSTRASYLQQRHSSLARSLQKEIRTRFGWTCQQCLAAIAVYLGLAVVCFNFLLPETRQEWTMIDSMYFAVVTFTTIGFGDLTPPDSHLARLASCVFALTGVATLGLALAVLGERMVDLETQAMNKAAKDVLTLFANTGGRQHSTYGVQVSCEDLEDIECANERIHRHTLPKQQSAASNQWKKLYHKTIGKPINKALSFLFPAANYDGQCPSQEACRRHREIYLSSKTKKQSSRLSRQHRHTIQFTVLLGFLLLLSYLIGNQEGWDFSTTLYFAITTSCTIGYGDKVPTTQLGRLCVVAFVPFAVGAMGCFLQQVAEYMVQSRRRKTLFGQGGTCVRELTVMDLEAMDNDGDGNVDWSEFLEFMLVAMNKVDEDLLWELRYQFDSLDVDDTGILSKQNLICMARRKLQQSSHKLELGRYKQDLLQKALNDSGSLRRSSASENEEIL